MIWFDFMFFVLLINCVEFPFLDIFISVLIKCFFFLFIFTICIQLKSKSLTHLDRIQPQINISSNDIPYKVNIFITLYIAFSSTQLISHHGYDMIMIFFPFFRIFLFDLLTFIFNEICWVRDSWKDVVNDKLDNFL